jgi:hypothetical protein
VQAARCCVIGHPKSFFTLYKPVMDSGQHVCHFDRDGRLLGSGAGGEQVAAAVQQACAAPGCVLVAVELVARGGFPLAAFQHVIVYASEPGSQAAVRTQLAELACPLHFLEVAPSLPLDSQQARQQAAAAAVPARPWQAGTGAAAAAEVTRVQHAARPAVAHQAVGASSSGGAKEWPIIISSNACRPIRWVQRFEGSHLGRERFLGGQDGMSD